MLWHARKIGIRALPCSYGALRDMGWWPFRHVTPVAATDSHCHRPRKRWWGTYSNPLPWFWRKPGENPYTLATLGSSTTKRVWAREARTSHLVAALLSKNGNAWWGTWHTQGATAFYLRVETYQSRRILIHKLILQFSPRTWPGTRWPVFTLQFRSPFPETEPGQLTLLEPSALQYPDASIRTYVNLYITNKWTPPKYNVRSPHCKRAPFQFWVLLQTKKPKPTKIHRKSPEKWAKPRVFKVFALHDRGMKCYISSSYISR